MNSQEIPAVRKLSTVNSQKGFTLLLAALVSSIVLALGIAVFEISIKQVKLSSLGRDSQFAFYTADTAAECALYWDYRYRYFSPSPAPESPSATCDGQELAISGRPSEPVFPYTVTVGDMNFFQDAANGNFCARITVTKRIESGRVRSIIHADGFNMPCSNLTANARAVQRSVEIRY